MSDDFTAARIAIGSIFLTLQNVFSTLVSVIGFAFMARVITESEMGVIAGVALLVLLVQVSSDLGFNSSIPKHVSELRGRGKDISSVVVSAIILRIPVCILLASAIFAFASDVSAILFKTTIYTFGIRLLSLDAVVLSLTPLLNGVLLGTGKLRSIAVYNTTSVLIRWLFITAFLLTGKGTDGIILGWIIGDLALLLMLSLTVMKIASLKKETFEFSRKQILSLLTFAFPLYISAAVSFLYTYYDKAIILAYLPLSDLGIYNTVFLAFSVLVTISGALGSALLPFYGMAYGKEDHKGISSGMKRASKYVALAIFPLTLGLMATSKPTLTLFAGAQYAVGWPVLAILSLFGLVFGLSPVLSNLLLIYGKTRTILMLSFIPVIISLAMLPLVWAMGLTGLAIVKSASFTLNLILTAYFVNKTVKAQIDNKAILGALAASIIMASTILILQQILYNTRFLLLYILVGAIVYIAAIRMLNVLNRNDFELLKQIIGAKPASYVAKILKLTNLQGE